MIVAAASMQRLSAVADPTTNCLVLPAPAAPAGWRPFGEGWACRPGYDAEMRRPLGLLTYPRRWRSWYMWGAAHRAYQPAVRWPHHSQGPRSPGAPHLTGAPSLAATAM